MKWWLRNALMRDDAVRIALELALLTADLIRLAVRRLKFGLAKLTIFLTAY